MHAELDAVAVDSTLEDGADAQNDDELLLICRIGAGSYACPTRVIDRIVPLPALIPFPDGPSGVVGLLNLHGAILAVVDPRPRLSQPPARFDPDQHLLVVNAGSRFALWIDHPEDIVAVPSRNLDAIHGDGAPPVTSHVARLEASSVPVLSLDVLDPGSVVQPAHNPLS